ncbi:MAG: DUF1700 domain-containing protein [Clostridia bacterium]|nr:DUF1700 domain-containing protein [Clostridia bacterium]
MTKNEFINSLRASLIGLPQEDIENSIEFYSEMIEDSMEDGMSEEEAVASLGNLGDIAAHIRATSSQTGSNVKKKVSSRRKLSCLEIVLLIISSPIWGGFAIGLFGVYISLWAVILSLYAAVISMAAASVAGIITFPFKLGVPGEAIMTLGFSLIIAGITIFAFFGVNQITKAYIRFTKWIFNSVKSLFTGGE